MSRLLSDIKENIFTITFDRPDKHNAFDDVFLSQLGDLIDEANAQNAIDVILLKANGRNFSAGADLAWMQRMAGFSKEENLSDAMQLAEVMYRLYHSEKATIAMVQGAAYGGGAGLAAVCDICIAAENSRFCFSEVSLGLIPAVISPYVIEAVGARSANALFLSAEVFDGIKARELGLVHHTVSADDLSSFTQRYAEALANNAPEALRECKKMLREVSTRAIDHSLIAETAKRIAEKRVSAEGQKGLQAFLNHEKPLWKQ